MEVGEENERTEYRVKRRGEFRYVVGVERDGWMECTSAQRVVQ